MRRAPGPAAAGALAALLLLPPLSAAAAADDAWLTDVAEPADPLEPVNRAVFALNRTLHDRVLEPAYSAYLGAVPASARAVVRNFFDNARLPFSAANAAAAGRLDLAGDFAKRFAVNATFGGLGALDVASEVGMPARDAFTVGDLLCARGVPAGPYVMLPLLGPSNARGLAGRAGDAALGYATLDALYPAYFAGINLNRYGRVRSARGLLDASIDPYVAVRSAHAQLDASCGAPR